MRCSQKQSSSENIALVLVSRCISTRWSLCWNQWDAIRFRCNQVPPGAIRCNQVPPGVIRCHQVKSGAIRCNQVQSGAIRCNQVQVQSGSGAIRWACNQGPPGAFKFSAPETRSLCTALHWKSPLFPFFPLIKYVIKPFRRFSGPVLDTSFPSFAEKYHWQREREK